MKLNQTAKEILEPLVPVIFTHSLYKRAKDKGEKVIAVVGGSIIDLLTSAGAGYYTYQSLANGGLGWAAIYGLSYVGIREALYHMTKPKKRHLQETVENVLSENMEPEDVKNLVESAPRDALRYAMGSAEGNDMDLLIEEHEILRKEQLTNV